jgi:hypothetical protein
VDAVEILCYGLTVSNPRPTIIEEPIKVNEQPKEETSNDIPLKLVEETKNEAITTTITINQQEAEEETTLTSEEALDVKIGTNQPITQHNQSSNKQEISTLILEEWRIFENKLIKNKKIETAIHTRGFKLLGNSNQLLRRSEVSCKKTRKWSHVTKAINVGNNLEPPCTLETKLNKETQPKIIDVGNNLESPAIISGAKNKNKLQSQKSPYKLLILFCKEPYRIRTKAAPIRKQQRLNDCSKNPQCRSPLGVIFNIKLLAGDGTNLLKFAKSNAQHISQFFKWKHKFRNKLIPIREDKILFSNNFTRTEDNYLKGFPTLI